MFKRTIAWLLMLVLLAGMLPATVLAQENEVCQACRTHKTVQRINMGGKVQIGQQLLSNVNVAQEYPNNPPEHVDTVAEKVVWIADQCRAKGITDPWQIALWLHDWLIYNANYDYTYSRYTADGVLLEGTGVCESYTRAYRLLLQQFGIENKQLSAPEMDHTWNLVKIDGQWCHIDVTWDDPNKGGDENHSYFGLTDERMALDHKWNRSNPNYPPCTSDINYYPIRMGIGFTTKQELIALLNKKADEKVEEIEVFYMGDDPDFPFYDALNEWYQTACWEYELTNCYFLLNENYAMVCVRYPDSDINDHVHQYVPIKQEPGCTSEGYTIHICNKCGDQYTDEYINPLGHTGGTATCTEKAVCTRCEKAYGELKPDNHVGGSYVKNTKQPTCTEAGYTGDTYCAGCDAKIGSGEILAPADHVSVPMSGVPVSCTTPGKTGGKQCYVCGEVLEPQQDIPAAGHTDRNKDYYCDICYEGLCKNHTQVSIPAKAPTCDGVGLTEGKQCSVCGEILVAQKPIKATGHNWVDATCTTPKICTNCGVASGRENGHSWKEATCTAARYCTVCGYTSGKPTGHVYDNGVDGTCNGCGIHRETTENRTVMHMFRMYDPNSGEHFYTGSVEERENLVAAGWNYEGVGFTFSRTTGMPVYRLYDPITGEHLYTMQEPIKTGTQHVSNDQYNGRDLYECEGRIWLYEGIAFNSAYNTEVPQYRLRNPNASRGAYHFTSSSEERDNLIKAGWISEGICFYSSWK